MFLRQFRVGIDVIHKTLVLLEGFFRVGVLSFLHTCGRLS